MVDFGQATYIDGTVVPGAELRRNTQRDAGDGSGVVRPGDLKVTQMDVPGAGVKVAVGDALVQSRAPGAERETYGLPLVTAQNYLGDDGAGLPGTGSSVPSGGRRDLVFVEILDPGLPTSYTPVGDWPSGQSAKVSVIQNVPASTRTIADVPALANVTGYELALITYPASTATVTNAMITDLRAVHRAEEWTMVRGFGIRGDNLESITATTAYPAGETWPDATVSEEKFTLDIPLRATQMTIALEVTGVADPSGAASEGWAWVQVGHSVQADRVFTEATKWQKAVLPSEARGRTVAVFDTIPVPVSLRGTRRVFFPRATRTVGTNATSLRTDYGSSVRLTVVFREVPV